MRYVQDFLTLSLQTNQLIKLMSIYQKIYVKIVFRFSLKKYNLNFIR